MWYILREGKSPVVPTQVPPTPSICRGWNLLLPSACSVCMHCDELAGIHLNVCLRDQGLVGKRKMFKIRSEQGDGREIENKFLLVLVL